MKVRLTEVARIAGVGIATVDRVLNNRGNVSPRTAKKVIEAARSLGLGRTLPSPYRRKLRFEVILAKRNAALFERLRRGFEAEMATLDRDLTLVRNYLQPGGDHLVVDAVRRSRCDAIVLHAPESPAIVEAVAAATAAGTPVVTLVSDLPTAPRLAYVGIDHRKAGRTAAFFMARMLAADGRVLAACDSLQFRSDAERIGGFRLGWSDYAGGRETCVLLEGLDRLPDAVERLRQFLRSGNGCKGIYYAGAEAATVERALAGVGVDGDLTLIGHDLCADARRMLAGDVMTLVIDQSPESQARRSLDVLLERYGMGEHKVAIPMPFSLHVKDSV